MLYTFSMDQAEIDLLYSSFGKLVRMHRVRRRDMTQERLGQVVGLSRTSITNIEKGRQHVGLHQLCSIAEALSVPPSALLPVRSAGSTWVTGKLPPGTEKAIRQWAEKLIGDKES